MIFSDDFHRDADVILKALPSIALLKSIHQAVEEIKDTKTAEEILEKELIKRLDQVTYGCYCEYPKHFKKLEYLYSKFRLRFNLEVKPIKSAYN